MSSHNLTQVIVCNENEGYLSFFSCATYARPRRRSFLTSFCPKEISIDNQPPSPSCPPPAPPLPLPPPPSSLHTHTPSSQSVPSLWPLHYPFLPHRTVGHAASWAMVSFTPCAFRHEQVQLPVFMDILGTWLCFSWTCLSLDLMVSIDVHLSWFDCFVWLGVWKKWVAEYWKGEKWE